MSTSLPFKALPFRTPFLVPKKESTDGIKFPSDGIELPVKSEPSSGLHLYSSMSVDALKKLCTLRKLSVPKKTLKEERINIIIAHDNMNKLMTAESMSHLLKKPKSATATIKTAGCGPRLINVLFSDEHAVEFAKLGKLFQSFQNK